MQSFFDSWSRPKNWHTKQQQDKGYDTQLTNMKRNWVLTSQIFHTKSDRRYGTSRKKSLFDDVVRELVAHVLPVPGPKDVHLRVRQYCNDQQNSKMLEENDKTSRLVRNRKYYIEYITYDASYNDLGTKPQKQIAYVGSGSGASQMTILILPNFDNALNFLLVAVEITKNPFEDLPSQ